MLVGSSQHPWPFCRYHMHDHITKFESRGRSVGTSITNTVYETLRRARSKFMTETVNDVGRRSLD